MENKNELILCEVLVGALSKIEMLSSEEAFDKLMLSIIDSGYEEAVKWIAEGNTYRVIYAVKRKDGKCFTENEITKINRLYWRFYRP